MLSILRVSQTVLLLYLGFAFENVFCSGARALDLSLRLLRVREILPGGTDAHESIDQEDCSCSAHEENPTCRENNCADDSTDGHGSTDVNHDLSIPH